jgi:uncharacterized protein (TIGR02099 family)
VLWLRYAVLPQIDSYRGDIVRSLESASGMKVTVDVVDGAWEGLRPQLVFTGVKIAEPRGGPAFALQRAQVTVSWWTLAAGDLRFHDVDLYSPELALRRAPDGLIYLAGKPINKPGGGDGAFSRWLLQQPRLRIHDATLVWNDELTGTPEARLSNVDIVVRKRGSHHHAALTALPPAALAGKVDIRADVQLAMREDHWQVSGDLYAETTRADLARLKAYLPVPAALRSGVGSVRVWAGFEPGLVKSVTADVNLRDVRAQLADDALPLELASLAGRGTYRGEALSFFFGTEKLAFRTASGLQSKDAQFSVSRTGPAGPHAHGEAKANGIDLKIAAALLDYLPVARELKEQAIRFAPRGRLTDSAFQWTGPGPTEASKFQVRAKFDELAINAVDRYPGASGLTGQLEGDESGGTLVLDSKNATLDVARIFRAPLAFDRLDAHAGWKREGKAIEVTIRDAHAANADAEVRAAGSYRTIPDSAMNSPGWVNLKGTVTRARAAGVANYLPNSIAGTRDWLDRSILEGEARGVRWELKGDLWHFPFHEGRDGRFLVEAPLKGVKLRYHPSWPAIQGIDGDIRFEGSRMDIRAREGTIFASHVGATSAVIANLGAKPPVLVLEGTIETTGADSARFLRESPLIDGPGAFTRTISIEGPARLVLKLDYPLWGTEPVRVAGDYDFAGVTASIGKTLHFTGARGKLAFTERSVTAPEVAGTMFGQPAVLRIATQPDNSVLATIDGRIESSVMGAFVPEVFARRMNGATEWKARMVSGRDSADLHVESTLKGLAIGLPEPFAKSAAETRSFAVDISKLGSADETVLATLEGGVFARIARRQVGGAERWNAAVKFGAPIAGEPVRDGLWLYGSPPRFDLDAWREAMADPTAPANAAPTGQAALELRGLDLRFGQLRYTGRDLSDLAVRMEREGTEWRGTLASPRIAGSVTWNPAGRGRIAARLERFALAEAETAPAESPSADGAGELPALDIVAEKFDFRGHALGRLELLAAPEGADWRIERLNIANDHASFVTSGLWRPVATGSITTLNVKLESRNLNALLGQFGFGAYVKRGEATLEGQLVWPGYPNEFALGNLSGSFHLDASKGQFAKIEPGAGKLLGLISLQSIPRRVTFDFRDVFSEGLAFDRIAANVKLARGILLTNDFEITGPATFVSMAGEVSLPAETQALTLRVVPEVGEGLALAATFIGTPVAGLTTLLVSKLLSNPLGKVVAYEYSITGSWDNPTVTRLSAPPPAKAVVSSAEPAKK